jgi:hypothetical protein
MKTTNSGSERFYTKWALLALAFAAQMANAQQDATTYTEQSKLIRAPNAMTRLGADLFGDKVNLYTGSLEFIQNDVSLPGNSSLPVGVGRHIKVGEERLVNAQFGQWDLEIPHLHGIFSSQKGWLTVNGSTARCSQFSAAPSATSPTASWNGTEYWHGSFLYVPGVGDQEMLQRSFPYAPTANPSYTYPIVTRNKWSIRCLPSMAAGNGASGEAFVAVSPDGTEYRFDWLVSRGAPALAKGSSFPESLTTSTAEASSSRLTSADEAAVGSKLGDQEAPAVSTSPTLRAPNKTPRARRIVEDSTLVRRDDATPPWGFC